MAVAWCLQPTTMIIQCLKMVLSTGHESLGSRSWKSRPTMTEHNTFDPGWASHPGETISDILAERRLSPTDFAERLGQTPAYAKELLRGRAEITAAVAKQLAEVLGGSQSFWINREAQYRNDVARLR